MSDRKQILLKRFLYTSQFTGGVFSAPCDVPICLTAERSKPVNTPASPQVITNATFKPTIAKTVQVIPHIKLTTFQDEPTSKSKLGMIP
jgi:hypothetical protein